MIHGKFIEVEPVIQKYIERGIHFYYFCGGRGIGKTYSALDLCRKVAEGSTSLFDAPTRFMYLRRLKTEAETISTRESNPFKKYNSEEGTDIDVEFSTKTGFGRFYSSSDEKDPNREVIGYSAGVSTFSNLRGIDYSDVSLVVFDECVPESQNKKPIKQEATVFLNAIESINRNRILSGEREVIVIMLSNNIDLGSDLLIGLNFTPILNNMIFKNQQKYTDISRSLHIEKYTDLEVSREKEQGVLYKFAKDTGFVEDSLSGNFVNNDLTQVRKVDLRDYAAYLTFDSICIYKHKSKNLFHMSQILMPSKYTFLAVERDKCKALFYWQYKLIRLERCITFDSYATVAVFDSMIGYKP